MKFFGFEFSHHSAKTETVVELEITPAMATEKIRQACEIARISHLIKIRKQCRDAIRQAVKNGFLTIQTEGDQWHGRQDVVCEEFQSEGWNCRVVHVKVRPIPGRMDTVDGWAIAFNFGEDK